MFSIRALFSAVLVATVALSALAQDAPVMDQQQIKVGIATHSHLNDATGIVNKNMAAQDNNIAIVRSNLVGQQDDMVNIEADELPAGMVIMDQKDALTPPQESHGGRGRFYGYRNRFYYPGFRGGYYGWRYPVPYWNMYGRRYYGGACPYGRIHGGFYYC